MVTTGTHGKITDCGIDFLTTTSPSDGRDLQLLIRADHILKEEEAAGNELERLRWQRYDLKVCGGVSAGLREDGAIVRLSGATAQKYWWQLVPYARNVTRMDVQVTVDCGPGAGVVGADHLREALRWRRHRDRAPRVSFNGGPEGIESVYLGRRTSETYARIYDKHKESDDPRWLFHWRYEVETKKTVATQLARLLYHHPDPQRAMRCYVHDYFRARGVAARFDRGVGHVQVAAQRAPTDDERRLKWLREQVDPVALGLAERGRAGELLDAMPTLRRLHSPQQSATPEQEG